MNVSGTKTIEELTDTLIDYRGKTPPKATSGVKLITAKVVKAGFIVEGDHEYVSEETYDTWMKRGMPRQWDILITTEAPLGEVAQLRTPERVALAQRVILLRGNPRLIDQQYYFQALKSPLVQAGLRARATGTTVSGIKQSELRQVEVPYHPLPIQHKIAAILSAYDDLIETNTRRIRVLEEMAQALYREWFVRYRFPGHENVRMVHSQLGKAPAGWTPTKVPDAICINPRTPVPKGEEKPYVAMNGLSNDSMLIKITEYRTGNSGAKYRNGDTLFARITPCLENGKTGFVQFLPCADAVGIGSTEFIVLRSKTLCSEYVYLLARTAEFRGNAIKSMSGASGRQRVQEQCFERFVITHPDPETLAKFSEVVRPFFRMIFLLSEKNANLRRTRDLLLPRLISGELDVSGLDIAVPAGAAG